MKENEKNRNNIDGDWICVNSCIDLNGAKQQITSESWGKINADYQTQVEPV